MSASPVKAISGKACCKALAKADATSTNARRSSVSSAEIALKDLKKLDRALIPDEALRVL
ncbi:MAG: hypothetical protein WAT78_00715 [Rhizobiaceae bacterium]